MGEAVMATREQLIDALVRADEAGDTESAQIIADEIKKLGSETPAALEDTSKQSPWPMVSDRDLEQANNIMGYNNAPALAKPVIAAYDIGSNIADASTFGYGGKAAAYLRSLVQGSDYDTELEEIRRKERASEDRSGWAGTAAKVATGARMGLSLPSVSGFIPQAAGVVPRLLGAATTGTLEGGGYGALDAMGHDQDVASGAMTGALTGGVLNTAGEGVMSALGPILSKIRGTNKAPTLDELAAQKNAAYAKAEDMGAMYSPTAIDDMISKIKADTINAPAGAREVIHPKTVDKVSELSALVPKTPGGKISKKAQPVSLYDMDAQRKGVRRDIMSSPDPAEKFFGQKLIDRIDETMADVDPSKVTTVKGTPQEAIDSLLSARDLNSRLQKVEQLSTAGRKAQRQADRNMNPGAGNPIRQKISSILDNDKKSLGFKPDEIEGMENIVKGSKTGNRLRSASSALESHFGLTAGAGIGGALGATLMPGVLGGGVGAGLGVATTKALGKLAENMSERNSEKMLQTLIKDVARGRKAKPARDEVPIDAEARNKMMRMLVLMGLQEDDARQEKR